MGGGGENSNYCKFGNFRERFIFAKLSGYGEITLSFTDIGKSCPGHDEFLSLQICLLRLFVKIKFSLKFPNLQQSYAHSAFISRNMVYI